eukprot:1310621-Karenia_brevis.AAC.1
MEKTRSSAAELCIEKASSVLQASAPDKIALVDVLARGLAVPKDYRRAAANNLYAPSHIIC